MQDCILAKRTINKLTGKEGECGLAGRLESDLAELSPEYRKNGKTEEIANFNLFN